MLFTPPVVGPQAVKVAMVEEGAVSDKARYTGTVRPYEDAVVYARVEGYVKALNVYPGDRVIKGQILMTIETSVLKPRLQHARADEAFWKAEYERDQKLFEVGAISESSFDKTRQHFEVAQAKVKLIKTQIGYAAIRSPLDGWVSERKVYEGVYVKKGMPVLQVDRLDRIRIQFDVAEKDLFHFHKGTTVYMHFPQIAPGIIRKTFSHFLWSPQGPQTDSPEISAASQAKQALVRGEVAVVFPAEDRTSRTGVVEVHLPNPGGVLKSNTYVVGDLVVSHAEKAIKIPRSALTSLPGGKRVVFLGPAFSDQGAAEMREVKLGVRSRKYVQILEGINPGEFVIYEGNRSLTDGENVMVLHREGGF